ncbi:MAG: penicillin-binding transpeptidase domain-containing protein [Polyangiales bacterium]
MKHSSLMLLAAALGCGTLPEIDAPQELGAPSLAAAVQAEQARLIEEHDATRLDILVLDVATRAVLARAHVGAEGDVEIASTLKPLTLGAAMDAGLDPARQFDGEGGRWTLGEYELQDHHAEDSFDAQLMLVRSSNIGAAKIAQEVGSARVGAFLRKLGLGQDIEAERWASNEGLVLSTGIGFRGTPMELAGAYATLAADGWDGGERVISAENAQSVRRMLRAATEGDGTGRRARIDGMNVAGKTGSSRLEAGYGAWFAGMAPADHPEIVVVVYAEVPEGYGGSVSAPSFARIASAWTTRAQDEGE